MTQPAAPKRIVLALTGASGCPYFLRALERLRPRDDLEVHLIASEGGRRVLREECDVHWQDLGSSPFIVHQHKNIGAAPASGSFIVDAMAVLPCSMHTLAAIAAGLANNLVHRTAAVQLKESRTLVLVPREAPLSLPSLRAMVAVREAGAVVLPACPGFYTVPTASTTYWIPWSTACLIKWAS